MIIGHDDIDLQNAGKAGGTRWCCGNRRRVNITPSAEHHRYRDRHDGWSCHSVSRGGTRVTPWRIDVATSAEYSLVCDSVRGASSKTRRRSTDAFEESRNLLISTFYVVYTHLYFLHNTWNDSVKKTLEKLQNFNLEIPKEFWYWCTQEKSVTARINSFVNVPNLHEIKIFLPKRNF